MYHRGKNTAKIRCQPCPNCVFCGAKGTFIYKKLVDRIFGAPGEWNLKKCTNTECEVIWLDPKPLVEDIDKAYQNYYTHNNSDKIERTGQSSLYYYIQKKYWTQRYGYFNGSLTLWEKMIGLSVSLYPLLKASLDYKVMYLPKKFNGKILDVGCGDGGGVELMQDLGWFAEGIDFDENAIRGAKRKGLNVNFGTLHEIGYPENHFDAIMMRHVFEHLYEPIDHLRECYRILRPNGTLVIVTPNNESLTHRVFKSNWRGLEPPRHLYIMTMKSLKRVVLDAGFGISSVKSCVSASYVLRSSYALSRNIPFNKGKANSNLIQFNILKLFAIINSVLSILHKRLGDELVLIAMK